MDIFIASDLDYVRESVFLLTHYCNDPPAALDSERLIKKYKFDDPVMLSQIDACVKINEYVISHLPFSKEELGLYFHRMKGFNECPCDYLMLFGRKPSKSLKEELQRVTDMSEEVRLKEFFMQLLYDNLVESEASVDQVENLTGTGLMQALQKTDMTDQERLLLLQIFWDPQPHLKKMEAYLSETIKLLKDCADRIQVLTTSFHRQWTEILKNTDIYTFLRDHAEVSLDCNSLGYCIYPTVSYFHSCVMVISDEETRPRSRDLFYVGIITADALPYNEGDRELKADLTQYLKLLGDKSKLDILTMIKEERLYGAELARRMNLSNATISHHMSALLDAGLVRLEKENTRLYYSSNKEKLEELLEILKQQLL